MAKESEFWGRVCMAPYWAVVVPLAPSLHLFQAAAQGFGGPELEKKYCDLLDKVHRNTGERLYAFGRKHGDAITHACIDAAVHLAVGHVTGRGHGHANRAGPTTTPTPATPA